MWCSNDSSNAHSYAIRSFSGVHPNTHPWHGWHIVCVCVFSLFVYSHSDLWIHWQLEWFSALLANPIDALAICRTLQVSERVRSLSTVEVRKGGAEMMCSLVRSHIWPTHTLMRRSLQCEKSIMLEFWHNMRTRCACTFDPDSAKAAHRTTKTTTPSHVSQSPTHDNQIISDTCERFNIASHRATGHYFNVFVSCVRRVRKTRFRFFFRLQLCKASCSGFAMHSKLCLRSFVYVNVKACESFGAASQ